MNLSSQSFQAPQPLSIPYPGIQQLSPFNDSIPSPQPSMNPMPLSTMLMNYNGSGGNTSGNSSLPPGMGKPGSNPKK